MAKHIFGMQPEQMPDGYAKAVNFPVLMMMDLNTGDGRVFASTGGTVREGMPHPISTMLALGQGHAGAVPSGALFEVTLDDESGVVSGKGFLLDDPVGLQTAKYVATKALNKFSSRVADVKVQFVEDMATGEYWINFSEWALSAGSFVETPAFKQAYGEITASLLYEDELIASLLADPMTPIDCDFASISVTAGDDEPPAVEVTADGSSRPPREWFFRPEADPPHKVTIDENGHVFGHLSLWETCHRGFEGRCVRTPRPNDGYASVNQPGVLTDKGMVGTTPVFAFGGHKGRTMVGTTSRDEREAAYGGIENTWGDVRLTEGVHGPWVSGYVRPGTPDDLVVAARASRVSGHWLGGEFCAVVSVNVPAFDVTGELPEMAAAFEFSLDADGEVSELFASFPACKETAKVEVTHGLTPEQFEALKNDVLSAAGHMTSNGAPPAPDPQPGTDPVNVPSRALLALLLEDED